MSGPKRNPDKLNTIGVVVVGICGAVLVYVTIVGLQAFYVNDTSELQTMKDYGGQDRTAKGRRADEIRNITEVGANAGAGTYRIPIDVAMKLVVERAKENPAHLVPALPPSTKATTEPLYGRGKALGAPAPAPAPEVAPPAPAAPTDPAAQPQPAAPPAAQPQPARPAPAAPVPAQPRNP